MYKSLLSEYINKLSKEDIIKYITKNNYHISDKEIDIIYFYIKNYWESFYNNDKDIWLKLRNELNENTFNQVKSLYQKYIKYIK